MSLTTQDTPPLSAPPAADPSPLARLRGLGDVSTVDDDRDARERSTGEAGHDDDHALLEAVFLDGDGPSDWTGA